MAPLLAYMLALALAVQGARPCPGPGPAGQERRAAGAPVVVRALVTHTRGDTAELWLQEVLKGAALLGRSLGAAAVPGLRDRRLVVTGWRGLGHCGAQGLEKEKSQVVLLAPGSGGLRLVPAGVFPHSITLERRVAKLLGWREWGDWASCSASCAGGTQVRARDCRLRTCEGRHREGRVCNTFSCSGATSALSLSSPRYYKPSRRAFLPVAGRPGAWALRASSYLLIPWAEAVGVPFPAQFTVLLSFRPGPGAEGVLFSLTDPASKQDYLSLNLGRGEQGGLALQLVQSSANGTRVVPLPAVVRESAWSQLAVSVQGRSSVKTFLDCVWVGTQIIDGRSLAVPAGPDLVIGYLVQTDLDQFTVTSDPADVGEQCSGSRADLGEEDFKADTKNKHNNNEKKVKIKTNQSKTSWEGSGEEGSGLGGGEEEEEGSGWEVDWSSWSPCSASCGPATQSRWSRCTDSAAMMDCIQAGLETKVSRSCRLPPCTGGPTDLPAEPSQPTHITSRDIQDTRGPAVGDKNAARSCSPGWVGTDCSTPLCSPSCRNGGRCVRPGVCACSTGYTGPLCHQAFCHPGCEHGGVCAAPFLCRCPPGYSGDHCQIEECSPACGPGRQCRAGVCTCPPGARGGGCGARSCLAYTRVKEPHRTGYRRIVSLGGPAGALPVYRTFHRTVYRTVTRCKEDLT